MNALATEQDFQTDDLGIIRARPAHHTHWHLLRHRTEARTVALMLEDMAHEKFDVYLPQFLRRRRVYRNGKLGTKLEWTSEALFRGYVFVRPMDDQPYSAKPMTRVYGVEGIPVGKMTDKAVDKIRAAESEIVVPGDGKSAPIILRGLVDIHDLKHVPINEERAAIAPGQAVEFELDMMDKFLRGVVERNDEGRLTVLVDFMHRSTAFTVDLPVKVRAVK